MSKKDFAWFRGKVDRDLVEKLAEPDVPTARELLAAKPGDSCWPIEEELARRVEVVLAEVADPPDPPADFYSQGWWDALARVTRLLNGEKP